MSEDIDVIEENVGLLKVLYPGKMIETTNEEDRFNGEREFVVEGLSVFIRFIQTEQTSTKTNEIKPEIRVRISKTEYIDDCESKMSQLIKIEELLTYASDEFKLLHEALRRQREKHGK